MPTTYEFAIASDVLEGPEGASYVGITPIAGLEAVPGLTAEQVQDALVAIKILLDGKLSGVRDHDVELPFRSKVNFTGAGFTITDDATNDETEIYIPSLEDYPHVESVLDEGVGIGVHRKIDFAGTGVTVVEDTVNDKYLVTIPGTYIERVTNEADDLGDQPELHITGTGMALTEDTENGRYVLDVPGEYLVSVTDELDTLGYQPELKIISDWATLAENTVDGRYELVIPTPPEIPDIPEPPALADEVTIGLTRLSVAPADPDDPAVPGDNDPRLADTRTPTDGSVTLPKAQDDVIFFYRCTSSTRPTLPKFGQMIFETDTLSCQKNVSSDPSDPNWVAIGSLADIPIADDGESNPYELVRADDSRLDNPRPPEDGSIELPAASPDISLCYICTSTTRPLLPKRGQLIFETNTNIVMKNSGSPAVPNWQAVGTGAANITFQEEGDTIGQRATVDVQGAGATVVDDEINEKTILSIPGMFIQDAGADVAATGRINFVGLDVTEDVLNSRIDIANTSAGKATDIDYGTVRLSEAAVDVDDPIALAPNDGRLPTQAENDALVGTSGTPGSGNRYLTETDTQWAKTDGSRLRHYRGTSAPSTPSAGQVWSDTTTTPPTLKEYSGSAWEPIGGVSSIKSLVKAGI